MTIPTETGPDAATGPAACRADGQQPTQRIRCRPRPCDGERGQTRRLAIPFRRSASHRVSRARRRTLAGGSSALRVVTWNVERLKSSRRWQMFSSQPMDVVLLSEVDVGCACRQRTRWPISRTHSDTATPSGSSSSKAGSAMSEKRRTCRRDQHRGLHGNAILSPCHFAAPPRRASTLTGCGSTTRTASSAASRASADGWLFWPNSKGQRRHNHGLGSSGEPPAPPTGRAVRTAARYDR